MDLIARLFPIWALKRAQAAAVLRAYQAVSPSPYRKTPADSGSGNATLAKAGPGLRRWARHLDENHDIAIAILDDLVNKAVGAHGIAVEPMIRRQDGTYHEQANQAAREAWALWCERPETTQALSWPEAQRLSLRTMLRDGDVFAKTVTAQSYTFPTATPFALELLEPDYCPLDLNSQAPRIVQGVECDAWGKPLAFHFFKEHPGDMLYSAASVPVFGNTKRVSADVVHHLKFTRRLRQARGVSIFHGVITRLDDLRDYEESERIAARVAASFTGYIKKSTSFPSLNTSSDGKRRDLYMDAGMIFDDLLPGEEVGTIGSNRPNPNLENFRDSQTRALSGGTGAQWSSIARKYDGTYSAQRQELVENRVHYERLTRYMIDMLVRPVYEQWQGLALATGALRLPAGIDRATLTRADYRGPGMSWISPREEVEAASAAIEARLASRTSTLRKWGEDPRIIAEQIAQEQAEDERNQTEQSQDEPEAEQRGTGDEPAADEPAADEQARVA